MATITFNTLKFVQRLEKATVSGEQASAMAESFKDARGYFSFSHSKFC